jgi:hypothetical protein
VRFIDDIENRLTEMRRVSHDFIDKPGNTQIACSRHLAFGRYEAVQDPGEQIMLFRRQHLQVGVWCADSSWCAGSGSCSTASWLSDRGQPDSRCSGGDNHPLEKRAA